MQSVRLNVRSNVKNGTDSLKNMHRAALIHASIIYLYLYLFPHM